MLQNFVLYCFLFSYPPKRHKFVYGKKIQCGKKSNVVRPSIDMVLTLYYLQNNIHNIDCEVSFVKLAELTTYSMS